MLETGLAALIFWAIMKLVAQNERSAYFRPRQCQICPDIVRWNGAQWVHSDGQVKRTNPGWLTAHNAVPWED